MKKSTVTADKVSLDGSSIQAVGSPVTIVNSSLEGKNGIEFSKLSPSQNSQNFSSGVELQGSTLAAPVISISGVTSDKGLYSRPLENDGTDKAIQNNLKTDCLHVDGVTTNKVTLVYGADIGTAGLSPYTEGGKTNVIVENVANTTDRPDGTLAFGLVNDLRMMNGNNPEESKDLPFVVTGKTQIRNISSAKGSAVGTMTTGISGYDWDNSYTDFHDLEISDIHGGDLSVGLYGSRGVVNVENADINMTGKENVYAGAYTASVPDDQAANLKQFAIVGSSSGKINLNNTEGNYTINGNVLADADNYLSMSEARSKFYKKLLENSDLEEGDKEEYENNVKQAEKGIHIYNGYQYGSINLAGHLKLYGDIYAQQAGTVNLHLQEGSYFEGQADDYADLDAAGQLTPSQVEAFSAINKSALGSALGWKFIEDMAAEYGVSRFNGGTINLTMDPGSKWQTRGKSFITSLDFNHGGLVDTRKGYGVSITIGKLTGEGGTFLMDLSKDAAKSDMLYVRDLSQSGVQHIQAYLQPDTKVEELKGIRFATTGGDDYKRDPAAKFDVSLAKDQGINNITLKVKNEKFNPEDTAANEKFNGGTYKPGNDYVTATFSGKEFTKVVPDLEKIAMAMSAGTETTDADGKLLPE